MKDPAFLFYPGVYLRDTQCIFEKTQVAYDRIMCEHMRNICISQQQLNFFTKRLSDEEKAELMYLLTETENGFQIAWVAESIEKRRRYSESRRENRCKTQKKTSKTYDPHMENEDENVNDIDTKIEYGLILENYHSLCPKMPKVEKLTDKRKGFVNARYGEFGMEKITKVLRMAGESDFLNGKNDKLWKADFEWLMRPENFVKVLEGKYSKNGSQPAAQPQGRVLPLITSDTEIR